MVPAGSRRAPLGEEVLCITHSLLACTRQGCQADDHQQAGSCTIEMHWWDWVLVTGGTLQLVVVPVVHELVWACATAQEALLVLLLHVLEQLVVPIDPLATEPAAWGVLQRVHGSAVKLV